MAWLQLVIEITPGKAAAVEDWLLEQGALSVTLTDGADQPLFEPPPGETPLWSDTRLIALFDTTTELEPVTTLLDRDHADAPWRIEPLEDRDWVRAWLDHFKPMRFGQRLWVIPGQFEAPQPEAINLRLDPGLAFGTGTHPTTALCLEWLDRHPPGGLDVIDYGCGSGILAIASLLLGANSLLAIDHDPQALQATRDNGDRNGVGDRIEVATPATASERRCRLLLANILANPLIELAPHFATLIDEGGVIVLSGILEEQIEAVSSAYRPWFTLDPPQLKEEWARLTATRLPTPSAATSQAPSGKE